MANQKKKQSFWSVFSYNNSEPFLDQIVPCNKKWILYNHWQWPAQWLDWEAPKHFPKPNLYQKNIMVTVCWSAAHVIHYSFLNPSKTITSEKYAQQIDEMQQNFQCLQLASINRKGPILHDKSWPHVTQPTLQMLNELDYKLWAHRPYSRDLLSTDYHFFKHIDNFLQGKCLHSQQEAENAFQEFVQT